MRQEVRPSSPILTGTAITEQRRKIDSRSLPNTIASGHRYQGRSFQAQHITAVVVGHRQQCICQLSNGTEPVTRIGVEELTTARVVELRRRAWRRAAQRSAGRLGACACFWWV